MISPYFIVIWSLLLVTQCLALKHHAYDWWPGSKWGLVFGSPCLLDHPRDKHQRPRLKVHGAWAFGYCLNIFTIHDNGKHNSSCIIEILAQTLEEVFWMHRRVGIGIFLYGFSLQGLLALQPNLNPFQRKTRVPGISPVHRASATAALFGGGCPLAAFLTEGVLGESLMVAGANFAQADNTVREAKNSFVMSYLHLLCARYHLRTTTLCHLRKSHTHCRIGAGISGKHVLY